MNPDFAIHPDTRLGPVHYTVRDIDRQIAFYQDALGMQLHWQNELSAGLGAGAEDLLQLTQKPEGMRFPRNTGMYHFALLYPDRRELARVIARLINSSIPNSPTDHVFTKTTYLEDPEGNTIELYCYSLEDGSFETINGEFVAQYADGRPSTGRDPLDLPALFSHLQDGDDFFAPMPSEVVIGHVHLYGNDLAAANRFYIEVLGFKPGNYSDKMGMADVELERPHVIAWNVWMGVGAQPPPPEALGIRYFSIVLPDKESLEALKGRLKAAEWPSLETDDEVRLSDPAGVEMRIWAE